MMGLTATTGLALAAYCACMAIDPGRCERRVRIGSWRACWARGASGRAAVYGASRASHCHARARAQHVQGAAWLAARLGAAGHSSDGGQEKGELLWCAMNGVGWHAADHARGVACATPRRAVPCTSPQDGAPRFCKKCSHYKPPRSHHCRVCDRCVLRMDHHCEPQQLAGAGCRAGMCVVRAQATGRAVQHTRACPLAAGGAAAGPWVNNCIGHANYLSFFQLLVCECALARLLAHPLLPRQA
jgi:hypothetical protein